ncbi:hypothetical protein PORY_002749 [Pneumocystis oryctolagi]|uniref:Uncharacterized protein n=1 Tax=Pneumocystis oryctolagi TaxID=42067 RepID=A0ACB7C8L8_9ASCO|nr:hypothetical protein PORY_002749 [Pneumocystis oryctolagi]
MLFTNFLRLYSRYLKLKHHIDFFLKHTKHNIKNIGHAYNCLHKNLCFLEFSHLDFQTSYRLLFHFFQIPAFKFLEFKGYLSAMEHFIDNLILKIPSLITEFIQLIQRTKDIFNDFLNAFERSHILVRELTFSHKSLKKSLNMDKNSLWSLNLLTNTKKKIQQTSAKRVSRTTQTLIKQSDKLQHIHINLVTELADFYNIHTRRMKKALYDFANATLQEERYKLYQLQRTLVTLRCFPIDLTSSNIFASDQVTTNMTSPSYLVAVLLVINSFGGSSLVFHYPPRPDLDPQPSNSLQEDIDGSDISSSSSSSEAESIDKSETSDTSESSDDLFSESQGEDPIKNHTKRPPWDKVLGFNSDFLAGLLTPRKIHFSQHQMTLFHIVMVMKPPLTQNYHTKINEMYTNVVIKLTMALKYEQARTDYVWSQSEMILHMREKAANDEMSLDALWVDILFKSSLASALATVYNAISASGIAHLTINNFDFSIFIPTPIIATSIPTDMSEDNRFLTSIDVYDEDMDYNDPFLTPHSSLLLLDDVESVLQNIPADANPSLSLFIKNIRPTQTLLKLSQQTNIPLKDIHVLAEHLIYWKRAIPIPPLHLRNIYFVSPAANMTKLKYQESLFRTLFPTLPPLPTILGQLSRELHPFSFYIPSKNHRTIYLNVLTWLIRYGWVCQLKTFIWIKVSKEIKKAVMDKQKNEDVSSSDTFSSDPLEELTDSIIREPHQASKQERAWIEEIVSRKPLKYSILFNRIIKYFNGKNALEKISSLEGIPRKDIKEVLQVFENDLEKTYFW